MARRWWGGSSAGWTVKGLPPVRFRAAHGAISLFSWSTEHRTVGTSREPFGRECVFRHSQPKHSQPAPVNAKEIEMSQSDNLRPEYRITETTITRDDSGNTALTVLVVILVGAVAAGAFYFASTRSSVAPNTTTTIITPAPSPIILPAPVPGPVPPSGDPAPTPAQGGPEPAPAP
jgi:hypothetical protein